MSLVYKDSPPGSVCHDGVQRDLSGSDQARHERIRGSMAG